MATSHDYGLVALSILVSVVAAYAARSLNERVITAARHSAWLSWLAIAATVDGIGTWSMHYTGMLGLQLPVPVLYDWHMVVISLLVAISGSAAALVAQSHNRSGSWRVWLASLCLGVVGISGLHYTAMAAMRFQGMHEHAPGWVALSVALAIAISLMALWVRFPRGAKIRDGRWRDHASALLRGSANPVMHYTAMAGITFMYTSQSPDLSHVVNITSLGILGISIVPIMGLVVALLTSVVDRLQSQRSQLRAVSQRLLVAQESERRLIARELHDEVGQAFTAVKLNLQALLPMVVGPVKKQVDDSISIVETALQQVRGLSMELRPAVLDDLGLAAALRWHVDRRAQRAGIKVQVTADLPEERLPADIETAAFRVAQEALTNIVRHARASRVEVFLRHRRTELELVIRDDGVGFDVPGAQARAVRGESLGVLGMQERVALVGGELEIVSAPGHGSEVRAHFPINPQSPISRPQASGGGTS